MPSLGRPRKAQVLGNGGENWLVEDVLSVEKAGVPLVGRIILFSKYCTVFCISIVFDSGILVDSIFRAEYLSNILG